MFLGIKTNSIYSFRKNPELFIYFEFSLLWQEKRFFKPEKNRKQFFNNLRI